MNVPRFGLIGASYVAASRVAPALRRAGIEPAALFDTDPDRFSHWQNEGLDLLTSDLAEILDSEIDAVYISSRNDQHAAHAIAAAQAGKHVLLEKPMALSVEDAVAVFRAAGEAGVQLAVNHHLPGSPLHATARRLVAEGRIGPSIRHASIMPSCYPRVCVNGGCGLGGVGRLVRAARQGGSGHGFGFPANPRARLGSTHGGC